MVVFDKKWFVKYQRPILLFINTRAGKWFFRITGDVPKGCRIVKVAPSSVTWVNPYSEGNKKPQTFSTDFRSHEKFGKRLYYGLKPFWWALHYLDDFFRWLDGLSAWKVLKIEPLRLNFGFDTLTAYPAAGQNSPVDGWVQRNFAGTLSAIIAGAGTQSDVTDQGSSFVYLSAGSSQDQYQTLKRSIFCFDTTLPGGAIVSDATLSIYGNSKSGSLATLGLGLVSASPALTSDLAASDYSNLGSTRLATDIVYADYSTTGYNDFILNSSGLSNINVSGISKFGLRSDVDLDSGPVTWSSLSVSFLAGLFADAPGTTQDPRLVVTYTVPTPDHTKNVAETVSVADSLSTLLIEPLTKDIAETVSVSDTLETASQFNREISETVSVTDTIETLHQDAYDQETQKKRGASPVWILKCPFPSTGTIYLSDHIFTISGWDGGITTKNWISRWGQIDEDIDGQQAGTMISDLSLGLLINPADDPTIDDILWTEANTVEKIDCELYLWFKDIDAADSPPRMKWAGNITDYEKIDELTYTVQLIDQSFMVLSQPVGNLLTVTDYPNADPDDVGKTIPIIYGSVAKVPALAIDAGWITTITEDISDSTTDIKVSDASGLSDGDVIQAEDEKIEIGTVSGDTLLSCTRAHDSTIATTHDKGISIGKIQTEYWYIIADHPVKAIGDIYVDGVRQTGGDFTKYIDHSGQAKVKFTALPLLRKSVDVEVDDNIDVTDYAVSNPEHNHDYSKSVNQFSLNLPSENPSYPGGGGSINFATTSDKLSANYDIVHSRGSTIIGIDGWLKITIGGILVFHQDYTGGIIVDLPSPLKFSQGTPADSVIVSVTGSDGTDPPNTTRTSWNILSAERICEIDATASDIAQESTKDDAIKDKIDGGKGYYVGLTGNSSADVVIGTAITANVDGYEDDGSGTYTGTPNALIGQPDHVVKHVLNVHGGLPLSSFYTDASASFLSKGYKFAGLITEYPELKGLLRSLAWQCRCWFRFSNKEAQLLYRPDSLQPVKTITSSMVRMDSDTGRTTLRGPRNSPLTDLLNEIDLHYDRDWSKGGEDAYQALESDNDSNSIARYGLKSNKELFFFDFVRESSMATDLIAFYIARYKDRHKDFSFETHLYNESLTFADGLELEIVDNIIVELIKVNFYPGSGRDMRVDRITFDLREY